MIRTIISLLLVFIGFVSYPQIPNGTWRDHLPYIHAKRIAEIDGKIYCATTGGMFSFNTSDNSIQKYSKVNGLSDIDISTIAYSEETKILVIAYSNGNIDLIRNDTIYNMPEIKLKTITGDKAINSIFFNQKYAYLACGFGISLIDLNAMVIKDSYLFGAGGSQIKVNDITFDGQYLYAATEEGIFKADKNDPNLVDYNAWKQLTTLPEIEAEYLHLTYFNGKLFTYYRNPSVNRDDIITINETGWKIWEHSYSDFFSFIALNRNQLVISSLYRTDFYDENENKIGGFGSVVCRHAIMDKQGLIWFADPEMGLVKADPSGYSYIAPNGPAYRDVGEMEFNSGILWAGGGNNASRWASKGAYSFTGEKWSSYNNLNIPELEGFLNISHVAIDPLDPGHVYGGSLGYGVVEFQDGALLNIFDENDGVLEPVPGYGHGYINITGMNFDNSGNLWISTSFSDNPVYLIKSNGNWEKPEFKFADFGLGTRIGDILPTSLNQVWLLIERYGLLVFSIQDNGSITERAIVIKNQEGDLLDRVFSIAEDRDKNIWIGTNQGPAIFYSPGDIFTVDEVIGYQVKIPRNDGTSNADFLLATEKITSIAVDGGNRKWLGTENSGVFLVSEDGKEEILHFTATNSPLPSNTINSIAINNKNGEVFFGTDKGIFSYRGQSTEGNVDFSNAYIFPNPVRENYQGDITITGLVEDVNVKITDVSGNLVFETKALGGQAIWNGKNFNGMKAGTGVYMVFCSNDDGSKTFITKLLFIH
jgi:hypothetical protein